MTPLRLNRINLLLSVIFFGMMTRVAAQSSPTNYGTVTISSPNATSLGKYGDIPVGYHTGIPEVNIPLYTIQAGPLKLPISLSYHLSGLKVMEPASWVGAGWSLNAGGMITREVMGAPDEAGNSNSSQQYGHFSDYGYNSYLWTSGQNGPLEDWETFANGGKDGRPDLYTFNFNGYTGKFFFRDDRTPVLLPEQDLQIIPSYSGGRSIDYFTIKTPDGTQYVFGNSPGVSGTVPIEVTNVYSSAGAGLLDAPPTSSWFLNKIVSADNQFTINLTYQPENYGYFTLSTFPFGNWNINRTGIPGVDLCKNIMQGVRLSQISFPNGTVTFNAGNVRQDLSDATQLLDDNVNTNAVALGGIQISDGNGYCKGYNFSYGYFSGSSPALPTALTTGFSITTDQQRLQLNSVQEVSCDGTASVPPYTFTYVSPTSVPRRLSFAVDHWGYYNGQDKNTGLMPTVSVNGSPVYTGSIRDASFPYMSYGSLSQITYPTGGTTTFAGQAETATETLTVPGNLQIADFALNLYGQDEFTQTESMTTNGNAITININTTCSQEVNVVVKDANGNTVINNYQYPGSTNYLDNYNYQYSQSFYTLPAGTYTVTCSIPTSSVGGFSVDFSEPGYTTETLPVTIGGTRITSITNTDGYSGVSHVTNFNYSLPGGTSSAILYSQPTYIQLIRNDIVAQYGFWTVNGFNSTAGSAQALGYPGDGSDYIMSAGSLRPMETVQGSEMGYTYVTVSEPGNGSTVYQYYASNEGFTGPNVPPCINSVTIPAPATPPNYPPAPLPFDYRKGELHFEDHYDNNGRLLKEIEYNPQYNTYPLLATPEFIVVAPSVAGNIMYLATIDSLNTVKKASMQTIERDYGQDGGYVTKTTTTTYGSGFHNQPTQVVTSTSTGDTLSTNIHYAADIRLPSCDAISDCSAEYNSACNSCLQTYGTQRVACGNSSSCLTAAVTAYQQCTTSARVTYVNCRNANYMGTNNAFNSCHLNAENSADAVLKPVLLLQDNYMNPVIETNDWRDSYLKRSIFVTFTSGSTPANFPYAKQTQLLNLEAPSANFSSATVSGNSIAIDNRYQSETGYLFSSGNPLQVTPHTGVTQSYIWDYNNTEAVAKVIGARADQVAYTSFEADGGGGWVIPSGGRSSSTAITGTQSYILPNGAISRGGLTSSTTYIVSYWSSTGSSYSVSGSSSVKQGKTISINNGTWTYFEHTVTGVGAVTITGGGNIDELRCYPANAQMETYTYSPLVGMTSHCDVGNRVTYYSYDVLGRLNVAKDQDGNIVKTYQYHYKGQ